LTGSQRSLVMQPGDVCIAPMAGQHRQHHGAPHIRSECAVQVALLRGIIAGEKLRAVRHPAVEQAALLQEVDEKWQLAEWRDRGGRIPFNVDPAGWIRPAKVSAIAERASTVGCSP
jgi:hypothetical protein